MKAYINITAEDGTLLDRIEVTPDDFGTQGLGTHVTNEVESEIASYFVRVEAWKVHGVELP